MTRDIDVTTMRYKVENQQKWLEEIKNIPFIQFPSDWKVQIIPPFGDAVVRFRVELPTGHNRSVYLDGRNSLGYWDMVGSYYWEVYPYRGDTGRCAMNDVYELLCLIADIQEGDDD